MMTTATVSELRNHPRAVIERARSERVTITDAGVPVAVLSAIAPEDQTWNVDTWLETILGSDWEPYDSGLAADIARERVADDAELDEADSR
jgi:prevent-host-death family protein